MGITDIVHDDHVLRLGLCRNVVIPAWFNPPTVAHVRAMGRAIDNLARRHGPDFGMFDVIVEGTPKFSDDVRHELGKLVADPKSQGHGAAHVLVLPGFAGVAVRAFLSTIFLVSRGASPNKVFAELRAGAAWLAPRLSTGREAWTTDEILAAQAEVTRLHERPPAP